MGEESAAAAAAAFVAEDCLEDSALASFIQSLTEVQERHLGGGCRLISYSCSLREYFFLQNPLGAIA